MNFNIGANINANLSKNKFFCNGKLQKEVGRYFAVSLAGLFIDLGLFSVAVRLGGLPWAFAAFLGFAAGVMTVWWLSIHFVFKNRSLSQSPIVEFAGFLAIGIAGLGVTEVALWLGIELLKIQPEFSKLAAAGATFIFNFALRKWLLFRKITPKLVLQQDQI